MLFFKSFEQGARTAIAVLVINEYYLNNTGQRLTKKSPKAAVELAICQATVGMEFRLIWHKETQVKNIYKALKNITYGTIRDRFNHD